MADARTANARPKDCNGLDLTNDAEAFSAFKKPIPTKFEYAKADQTVQTKEGPVSARAGDAILTGVAGERWPITRESFDRTYDVLGNGMCSKKKIMVIAKQMGTPFQVSVSWSRDPITGKEGDFIVQDRPGHSWIVDQKIFRETYEIMPRTRA